MSLQRGANVRGWEGVTKSMAVSHEERLSLRFSSFSLLLAILVSGLIAIVLAESDVAVAGKVFFTLAALFGMLVLVSGVSSMMMARATGQAQGDIPPMPPKTGSSGAASGGSTGSATTRAAAPAAAAPVKPAPAAAAPTPPPAAVAPTPPPAAPVSAAPPASASDGPVNPGTKPATMAGPRGGTPDDLTLIKGVGPKLAELCHSLGFYHFDQISKWSADEVAWVDQNLEGFKGRVTRDDWVDQAKILAAGGQTEFSQRQG